MKTKSLQVSTPARRRVWFRGVGTGLLITGIAVVVVLRARSVQSVEVVYVPAASLEAEWGKPVAVTNITMHSRRDGSDRIGFFQGDNGTVWGLPLASPGSDLVVRGCAPAALRGGKVTDSLPADVVEILGASDFLSNPVAGTSAVHLLVRATDGALRWHRVSGKEFVSSTGTTCREPSLRGRHRDPLARYHYFRIAAATAR